MPIRTIEHHATPLLTMWPPQRLQLSKLSECYDFVNKYHKDLFGNGRDRKDLFRRDYTCNNMQVRFRCDRCQYCPFDLFLSKDQYGLFQYCNFVQHNCGPKSFLRVFSPRLEQEVEERSMVALAEVLGDGGALERELRKCALCNHGASPLQGNAMEIFASGPRTGQALDALITAARQAYPEFDLSVVANYAIKMAKRDSRITCESIFASEDAIIVVGNQMQQVYSLVRPGHMLCGLVLSSGPAPDLYVGHKSITDPVFLADALGKACAKAVADQMKQSLEAKTLLRELGHILTPLYRLQKVTSPRRLREGSLIIVPSGCVLAQPVLEVSESCPAVYWFAVRRGTVQNSTVFSQSLCLLTEYTVMVQLTRLLWKSSSLPGKRLLLQRLVKAAGRHLVTERCVLPGNEPLNDFATSCIRHNRPVLVADISALDHIFADDSAAEHLICLDNCEEPMAPNPPIQTSPPTTLPLATPVGNTWDFQDTQQELQPPVDDDDPEAKPAPAPQDQCVDDSDESSADVWFDAPQGDGDCQTTDLVHQVAQETVAEEAQPSATKARDALQAKTKQLNGAPAEAKQSVCIDSERRTKADVDESSVGSEMRGDERLISALMIDVKTETAENARRGDSGMFDAHVFDQHPTTASRKRPRPTTAEDSLDEDAIVRMHEIMKRIRDADAAVFQEVDEGKLESQVLFQLVLDRWDQSRPIFTEEMFNQSAAYDIVRDYFTVYLDSPWMLQEACEKILAANPERACGAELDDRILVIVRDLARFYRQSLDSARRELAECKKAANEGLRLEKERQEAAGLAKSNQKQEASVKEAAAHTSSDQSTSDMTAEPQVEVIAAKPLEHDELMAIFLNDD